MSKAIKFYKTTAAYNRLIDLVEVSFFRDLYVVEAVVVGVVIARIDLRYDFSPTDVKTRMLELIEENFPRDLMGFEDTVDSIFNHIVRLCSSFINFDLDNVKKLSGKKKFVVRLVHTEQGFLDCSDSRFDRLGGYVLKLYVDNDLYDTCMFFDVDYGGLAEAYTQAVLYGHSFCEGKLRTTIPDKGFKTLFANFSNR